MAVELATGYVRLMPSARGFKAALEQELGPDMRHAGERLGDDTSGSFNKKFGSGLKKGATLAAGGFAAAFAGAAVIGKQSIDAASDLEEVQNKVNVVFGEGADVVNDWASSAATALGQSRRQALDAAGGFGNLFTQLGIGSDEAATMSTSMVTLASDFASFHNADISEVIEAQSAAFRGEYDSVQKFVPTINAAAVEQKALEMGLAETSRELTAQDKALAVQELLMSGAGKAAGDFARTSDGLANQQRILSAQFEDTKAKIGAALIPAMTSIVSTLTNTVIPAVQDLAEKWMPYLRAGFENVTNWVRDNWPQIQTTISEVWENIKSIFTNAVAIVQAIWEQFGEQIWSIIEGKVKLAIGILEAGFKVISGIFETFAAIFRGDWSAAWEGIKKIFTGVWDGISAYAREIVNTIKQVLSAAWEVISATFRAAWEGIVNFFRDNVYQPLVNKVGELRDTVGRIIQEGVDKVKAVWEGLKAIVDFLDDEILSPIREKFNGIKTFLGNVFEAAVEAVKSAWNMLKDVVKAPINIVIGFYNSGIRGVWNAVISKIPGVGDLPEISQLAKGGWVPGSGNRDTVPAMLTPGEFVVTKRAAQVWGPDVLAALNRGTGTIDPGIFGYAAGGEVRSVEEVQEWMRQQAGKPYRFPDVGPNSFDCSGFTSALVNFALGLNPWSRRHSSGSVGSDGALQPGDGTPEGLSIGARRPYMTNSSGDFVGHTAATVAGMNAEATPPAVRLGHTGAFDLPEHYFLPEFGGLSEADKAIAASVASLKDMRVDAGGPPLGDLLTSLFNRLPGMIYDFLIKALPKMIVKAVQEGLGAIGGAAKGVFKALTPFADGGMVRRNGPILVGERGPEALWGSAGQYVESFEANGRGGVMVRVDGNVYGDDHIRQVIREEARRLEWLSRATAAA